ncbi:MAG TPA: VCBS repeat-containing protein [Myxococcota bacterium]|nr:VCBS repeat-containing protein [Myxococcota bacterium]
MTSDNTDPVAHRRASRAGWYAGFSLLAAALAFLLFVWIREPAVPDLPGRELAPPAEPAASLAYRSEGIGDSPEGHPVITHVAIDDLDRDGLSDVIVCDAAADRVSWIRQEPLGVFTEIPLGEPIRAPAHVSVDDVNRDGRSDLLVASMGVLDPNNDRIGKVIALENLGEGRFRNRVLAENTPRVTDVRAVELNGDAELDLVVGAFGYSDGEIWWMEGLGDWRFRSHALLERSGTIMTPVADFDRDGRADFAALVSQEWEEVHWFRNLGGGELRDSVLWKSDNEAWNSSGLDVCDVNRDGLPDLIFSNGDGFETGFAGPAPWHGLQWLENLGDGSFRYHRIGDMPGCYSPSCADLDGDGDVDIVTVSAFNHVHDATSVWMTAWLNDGRERFSALPLAREPTRLITVAAGDLDGDGTPELVTGGLHASPPYILMSRVLLWRRR